MSESLISQVSCRTSKCATFSGHLCRSLQRSTYSVDLLEENAQDTVQNRILLPVGRKIRQTSSIAGRYALQSQLLNPSVCIMAPVPNVELTIGLPLKVEMTNFSRKTRKVNILYRGKVTPENAGSKIVK